jgi:tetratricopeptide (TPR) repeat protein
MIFSRHRKPERDHFNLSKKQADGQKLAGAAISRARKRIFLIITVVTPFIFFGLLELGLRVFGYGPNLSLFLTETFGGKTYHIMNPDVKFRYFSTVAFSPNTSPDYFLVPKPEGMYRIFCLGGSTTIGFPYGPIGSFSSFLRDRLKATFPHKHIEVINLGMTATNSYTAADIASELVNYEPDLIIDYDGHNEFYGALGVASNESVGRIRFLTRLYLRLVHVRTFLLMRSFVREIGHWFSSGSQLNQPETLMERLSKGQYIPFGSSEYTQALQIFRANLDELKEICESHKIPLILSPQISNLRDEPPFVSQFAPGLSDTTRSQFAVDFADGSEYWKSGKIDSALTEFHLAMALDSGRADAHYWIARCLDSLGREAEALRQYTLARDFDQLRFRASSDFNQSIKEAANADGVYFAPLEAMFAAHSKDGIIGDNLILEHLHPRLEGNFLLAKDYARVMREHGLLATSQEWSQSDTISDQTLWDERPLTKLDEVAAELRIARLTSDWPFTKKSVIKDSVLLNGAFGTIVNALVDGRITWERAHVAAAEYYTKNGNRFDVEKEYSALIDQLHYNNSAYLALGQLYGFAKEYDKAEGILSRSLDVEPSYEAYDMLGRFQLAQNHPEKAIPFFRQSYSFQGLPDEHTSAGFLLALSMAKVGRTDEARSLLREILSLNPTLRDARDLLNSLNNHP